MDGFRWNERGELSAAALERLDWLEHGFGGRNSAAVTGPLATVKQVHSGVVMDAGGCAGERGEADALISDTPGLAVGVRTADCLPILLADPGRRVIAVVHAGWRGTVAEIAERTLQLMHENYGTNPEDVIAVIGPGIGKCCFEVGPEVAREFSKWDPRLENAKDKHFLDLAGFNRRQLLGAGVKRDNVSEVKLCTMDRTDLLYSFRQEKEKAGRMVSWMAIKPR